MNCNENGSYITVLAAPFTLVVVIFRRYAAAGLILATMLNSFAVRIPFQDGDCQPASYRQFNPNQRTDKWR